MAERPTPAAVFKRARRAASRRSSTACRRSTPRCSRARICRERDEAGAARCARRPARRCRPRSASAGPSALRLRHPRRHRLDRDAAHLPVQPARRRALRHHRQAGARLRGRTASATTASRCADGEVGELQISGPSARAHVLEPTREDADDLPGRVDAQRRQVHAATPTATTPTPAAPTTCSRSAASTSRRSRSRRR